MAFLTEYGSLLLEATGQTLFMTVVALLLSYLIGMPLGVLLYSVAPRSLRPLRLPYHALDWSVNAVRSIPFIILLIFLIPFTKLVAGTFIGIKGAVVPLTVCAIPFVARMVQSSLGELDRGVIESSRAMGATGVQIVCKVLLPEALPSLLRGMSITAITLFGYTAMAGTVGAGGLGDVAIRFGLQRYQRDVMIACVILMVLIVQVIQFVFDRIVKKIDKNV